MRRTPAIGLLFCLLGLLAGCPSTRTQAPEPTAEEAKPAAPPCGKIFKDGRVHGGSGCCNGPAGQVLTATADAMTSMVMVHHPPVPPGSPAPTAPDALLPWAWKKVPLRDAIGFQAMPSDAGKPPETQTVLWAGRGRQIVALRVAKAVCSEAQAKDLLQKAIDTAK